MMSRRGSHGNVSPRQRCISRDGIELVLRSYASHLKNFQFEAARSDIEDEKCSFASSSAKSAENTCWMALLGVLSQLASVEKAYFSMAFLLPKKVFRKEQTKINYNACRSELSRISATLVSSNSQPQLPATTPPPSSTEAQWSAVSLTASGDSILMMDLSDSNHTDAKYLVGKSYLSLAEQSQPQTGGMLQCEESDGHGREYGGGEKDGRKSLVDHFAKQFEAYVSGRIGLMEVYCNLSLLPSGMYKVDDVMAKLDQIRDRSRGCFNHPFLVAIEDCFNEEIEIVTQMLRAGRHISCLRFLPAMMDLRQAQDGLIAWTRSAESKQTETHQSSWLFWPDHSKKDDRLALFKWLRRFHDALLSKATFYFYEVLSKPCPGDFAKQATCVMLNYMQKIEKFHKRSDAELIALILDSSRLAGFESLQFRFPSETGPSKPAGLSSFPVIYSYPPSKSLNNKDRNYMPALVMWLSMIDHASVTPGEVQHNAHQNEDNFFVTPVEQHLFLFVVFSAKKHNRDSAVTAFMHETYQDLQFHKLFMSMRAM